MSVNKRAVKSIQITCQICFEYLKDPCVCTNLHPFCSECLDEWLVRDQSCPTCRVAITKKQLIIGSNEERAGAKQKISPLLLLYQFTNSELKYSMRKQIDLEAKNSQLLAKIKELETVIDKCGIEIKEANNQLENVIYKLDNVSYKNHRTLKNLGNIENTVQEPIKKNKRSLKDISNESDEKVFPVRRSLRLSNKTLNTIDSPLQKKSRI